MVSPPWFYYPFDESVPESLSLSGEEANHILAARRMRLGDEIVLSNGQGKLAHCTVVEANKKARTLTLRISLIAHTEPPRKQIILASALPKGDRLPTMLDMACQLGMTQFQPLQFEHSVNRWSDKLHARCERIVTEASKQCKTARIADIKPIQNYADYIASDNAGDRFTLLADPFGRSMAGYSTVIEQADTLCAVVGPEGGLSEPELKLAKNQDVPMLRLAEHVLRTETAAVAAMTALQSYNL